LDPAEPQKRRDPKRWESISGLFAFFEDAIFSAAPAVVKALRFAPAIAGGDPATDTNGGKP
jgi:hypothetical protein